MQDASERTLAVLFGPEQVAFRSQVESRIVAAGFNIIAESSFVAEELEEAGLDIDSLGLSCQDEEKHVALVLERKSAVAVWKELAGEGRGALNKGSLAAAFPDLRTFASPTFSASRMSIATLFPHFEDSTFDSPLPDHSHVAMDADPNQSNNPPPPSRPNPPTLPHNPLSNASHPPPPPRTDELSPSIARALQKLEGGAADSEKRFSSASDTLTIYPSADAGGGSDEERRVFTYHSRDNTQELGASEDERASSVASTGFGDYIEEEEELELLEAEQAELDALDEQGFAALAKDGEDAIRIQDRVVQAAVKSLASPAIQPRLTKSAALRLGIAIPPRTPRTAHSSSQSAASQVSTPTTASTSAIDSDATPRVKSLAAPTITPRQTKTSMRRTGSQDAEGQGATSKVRREAVGTAERSIGFENVPGHKRRESIQVASTAQPKIAPRLTKAAALRAGIEPPAQPLARQQSTSSLDTNASSASPSKPARRESLSVKSTAPPLIVPRPTKSSALRAGNEPPPMQRGKSTSALEDVTERDDLGSAPMQKAKTTLGFEGVPGHKRRESIQVASTAPPKVTPRLTKAAALRAGVEITSPVVRRPAGSSDPTNFEGVPGHKRRESIQVVSSRPPSITPRLNRSTLLRTGGQGAVSGREPLVTSTPLANAPRPRPASVSSAASLSQVASSPTVSRRPSIVPRSNKSAELRAAKRESAILPSKPAAVQVLRPATSQGILRPSSALAANGGQISRGHTPKMSFNSQNTPVNASVTN